jgi:lipopolysaccharide biosynthesis regulator YciM
VRASLLLGDLDKSQGDVGPRDGALEARRIAESGLPRARGAAPARRLPRRRAREEGLTLLTGYLERYPSLDLLDTVFQQTLEAKGPEQAYALVRDELKRNPTLLGLDRLLEAQIIAAGSPDKRRDLELVRSLVHGHTRRLRALSLRDLRLQGAPVPLALPRLRRLGNLSAAAHRGVRTDPVRIE